MATIYQSGYVFKDDGTAVSGATVQLYQTDSTTLVTILEGGGGTSTTTNSDGYYSASVTEVSATSGYDVKITSGSSVRYRRGNDRLQLEELDIRNDTGNTQGALFVANTTNNSSNKVATFAGMRTTANVADNDEIYMSFEMKDSGGALHEYARITAIATDVTATEEDGALVFYVADNDSSGDLQEALRLSSSTLGVVSATTTSTSQFNNTITVGVDDTAYDIKFFGDTASRYWLWDTSADGVVQRGTLTVGVDDTGHDVKFFGASAGAYMLYDESADQLIVMGASADATTSTGKLLLATSLTDINANDVLGKIEFQAPSEAGGGDSTTIAAAVEAVAQGTFSSSVNATDLIFKTGHSEAATEKFRITSQGELGIGGATYGSSGDVLTSGGAGAAPTWATPATGDITGVTAGTGLSGGGTTGGVTLALDLSELTDTAIANGDYIVFTDTTDSNATVKGDLADVATLFAGDGLQASSSVLSLDLVSNGGLEIASNELQVATGIAQHDIAQYAASVADDDFLRIDGTKVEGLSAAEVAAAIESSIDAVGTIATGVWNGDAIGATYLPDASPTAQGVSELATDAEINTSTDTGRTITPAAFSDSNYGIRYVGIVVADSGTALTTGDGKAYFHIPAGLAGMDLMEAHAEVNTAPVGSTIIIEVSKNGASTQMLTTNITIAAGDTGSDQTTAPVFATDGSEAVATNDLIQININQIGSSTAGSGLIVTLGFRIP